METPFKIINGPSLSKMCDYSFGDHHAAMDLICSQTSGIVNLIDGFMKEANDRNMEFLDKCKEYEGRVMTLYIDNVRLYNRPILAKEGFDAQWIGHLLTNNDLLALCEKLVDNHFIIFSHQEDTCIDENIKIPKNVLGVYAVNAEYETERLHPFPFGVQRQMNQSDRRQEILKDNLDDEPIEPQKLFYISCAIDRNDERKPLVIFQVHDWATTRFDPLSMYYPYNKYQLYLNEIRNHKFIACPRGHANCYDTHKIWESLYLRRVPVVRDFPYFRRLLQGFPVLFVKEWSDITEQFLKDNDNLYQEAQNMSLKKLDLNVIYPAIVNSYKL
jgi:hypothetical protein